MESKGLVLRETEMREVLPAWGPPIIAQSARSIAKWVVCVWFTTAGTKNTGEKELSLFLPHLCMQYLT